MGMLTGTLGEEPRDLAPRSRRFVDLLAGSGAVSRFVAVEVEIEAVAIDLLKISSVIAGANIERTGPIDAAKLVHEREQRADY
ncbi:methylase of polypeptide subunit release factors [Salinibacterium sp. CAN_S4]|uniref:hypothetical protein n=1 Tax=Salinibacterium sp. CAN_S4 TaxID=2787727 RepID=UPI0018F0434C